MYSSNIASARIAMEAGVERQRAFLGRLGLLKPAALNSTRSASQVRNYGGRNYRHRVWLRHCGQPLQVATAVSAVVNGGIL